MKTVTLQIRKAGWTLGANGGKVPLWVITERGSEEALMGPDRLGNHAASFTTFADAAHAANWRAESTTYHPHPVKIERGAPW